MPITKNILETQETPEVTTSNNNSNVAVVESNADWSVANRVMHFDAVSGIIGDWDETDVAVPTLRISRGSGAASAEYAEGTLLIGDDEILAPPNLKNPRPEDVVRFIPYRLEKKFREDLTKDEIDAGMRPNICATQEEVMQNGGTISKYGNGKRYKPCADMRLLVERPDGCTSSAFGIDLDGKLYANVIYYARGTDFYGFTKDIFNAVPGALTKTVLDESGKPVVDDMGRVVRQTLVYRYFWNMRVTKRQSGDFQVMTPDVKLTNDEPGQHAMNYIMDLIGG